ncbi:hypothetical protein Leryth_024970 [Lithospermum erythrorhizon]|nr:hypothetical protein Leryth_024970 [Lithospermum erythrorhizon]
MEADDECSGDSLNYRLLGGNMRDQRVQRPFIDRGKQDSARRFTNDGNSYKDINHKERQGIGIEKRLQRLEKIVGVDPQIQSSGERQIG